MPVNAHERFRDEPASCIVTNYSLWTSRREGEGPGGEKGKNGRRSEKGRRTEGKGDEQGKMLRRLGRGPDKRLAGRRWEAIEGGGKDVDGKKESCWSLIQFLC